MRYHVDNYGPDGHDEDPMRATFATLEKARAEVKRRIGIKILRPQRRWHPPDALEGYHDLLDSEPDSDGCGGCLIIEERDGQ